MQAHCPQQESNTAGWRLAIFKGLSSKLDLILKAYVVLAGIELCFFPSLTIAFCLLTSFAGILLTRISLCYSQKLLYFPLSTLALLFYCLFFEILPLPVTLLELKPITYNLRNPRDTFIYLIYLQAILLGVHTVYVHLTKGKNVLRNLLHRVNFFVGLSSHEVWFLILGSFVWYTFVMITKGLYTEESLNVNATFGVLDWTINLFFSTYFQVVFLFYFRRFNNITDRYRIRHGLIILLSILIFIIGIGTNMRTAAVTVFANCAFYLTLYVIYFPSTQHRVLNARTGFFALLLLVFFMGPFQRMSESMVSVRGDRSGKNASQVFEMTMGAQGQKDSNGADRHRTSEDWDEHYLNSHLLNRFCSLKILDETIYHAKRLDRDDRQKMKMGLLAKLFDQVPGVFKAKLGVSLSTAERHYSLSDLLYYLSASSNVPLGGVKIGTLQGLGLAIFGHWFPLMIIPLYFIMFYLMDSLVLCNGSKIIIPLFVFAGLFDYIALLSDRHFYLFEIRFIFRGYWEAVIAYALSINILKRLPFLTHR